MGRVARKKQHKGNNPIKAKYRTKRRTKDIDQIHVDLKPDQAKLLLNQEVNYEIPGNAQFYCIYCARYFMSEGALQSHCKTKPHKQRVKALSVEPYTQEEAERAAGMGSYRKPQPVQIQDIYKKPEEVPKKADFKAEMSGLASNFSAL